MVLELLFTELYAGIVKRITAGAATFLTLKKWLKSGCVKTTVDAQLNGRYNT